MNRKTVQNIFLIALCVATFVSYLLTCFYTEAVLTSDDLTLFNPVYQFLTTGHLYYPVHGIKGIITVHPPVQYYWVAFAIKAGFNSQQAYTIPFLTAFAFLLATTLLANFSFPKKLAVILSVQFLFIFPVTSIRPDCTLALLWFTSLLWWLWGAEKKYPPALLFGVGFLTAVASTLHYYAAFINLSVVLYIWVLIKNYSGREVRNKIFALLTGFAVVLLPYYFLFVIPNLQQILLFVKSNQTGAGDISALSRHFQFYYPFTGFLLDTFFLSPVLAFLLFCFSYNIPICLIAILLLLTNKKHRIIALASTPLVLLVLFYSRGKSEGYLMPELLLFSFAATHFFFHFFGQRSLLKKYSVVKYFLLVWVMGSFFLNVIITVSRVEKPLALQQHAMHQVRQAAQNILGTHACIGGRISAWYISGGETWEDISTHISEANSLKAKDSLLNYLSGFNAIVETRHMANAALNTQHITPNTLYLDSLLQLKGFIFSDNYEYESEMACLFYSRTKNQKTKGYVCQKQNVVYEVNEVDTGSMVFLSYKVARQAGLLDSMLQATNGAFALNYFPLPDSKDPAYDTRYEWNSHYLAFMLIRKEDYLRSRSFLETHLEIREAISCSVVRKEWSNKNFENQRQTIHYVLK